jgi:hypothetical protein
LVRRPRDALASDVTLSPGDVTLVHDDVPLVHDDSTRVTDAATLLRGALTPASLTSCHVPRGAVTVVSTR